MKSLEKTTMTLKSRRGDVRFRISYSESDFEKDCELSEIFLKLVPEEEKEALIDQWVWILNNRFTDSSRAKSWKASMMVYLDREHFQVFLKKYGVREGARFIRVIEGVVGKHVMLREYKRAVNKMRGKK